MTAERLARLIKEAIDEAASGRPPIPREDIAATIARALRERNFLARVQA